jgi:hypothetical protein
MVYDQYQSDDLSPLGYKCAPPQEPKLGFWLVLFAIASAIIAHKIATLSVFTSYFTPAIIAFAVSIIIMITAWHKTRGASQRKIYLGKLKEWENSWLCMQCNNQFTQELS